MISMRICSTCKKRKVVIKINKCVERRVYRWVQPPFFWVVPRWGFEPQSSEPESDILSIELPGLVCLYSQEYKQMTLKMAPKMKPTWSLFRFPSAVIRIFHPIIVAEDMCDRCSPLVQMSFGIISRLRAVQQMFCQ